jgi:hypothetical protein
MFRKGKEGEKGDATSTLLLAKRGREGLGEGKGRGPQAQWFLCENKK